jgi:hypothetical protein
VLDRIAAALDIETYQLFAVSPSPETVMERLHDTLVSNLERVVAEVVKQAFVKTSKDMPGTEWPQRGLSTGTPLDCLGIPRHRIGTPVRRTGTPVR